MNLREAAQQALEALEEYEKSYQAVADGLKPLRAALASPTSQESRQAEPVAWLQIGIGNHEGTVIAKTTKPKTWNPEWWWFDPLYTAPPKRQPLTDEQISEIFISNGRNKDTFARAIERAHGIGDAK